MNILRLVDYPELLCFSRTNDECNKKQPSDCDTLEYRNGEGKFHIIVYSMNKDSYDM